MKTAIVTILLAAGIFAARAEPPKYFEIRVVDEKTGRGIPLVQLMTVNHIRYFTDSAGCVAFYEPAMMNHPVYFYVNSDGYSFPTDPFGYAGVALKAVPGTTATIRMERENIAERLYRTTGEGIYNDTVLLGKKPPIVQPVMNAEVLGQDSVQAVVYRNKIYWFWGDTMRLRYALGQFRTSGATSEFPKNGGLDPNVGINLNYFTGKDGFSRPMCAFDPKETAPVWVDGLCVVPDEKGREHMVTHFRRGSTGKMLDHGLMVYDDAKEEFDRVATFKERNYWRSPGGWATRHGDYVYFGGFGLNVRAKATYASLLNPASYEAWTCLEEGTHASDAKIAHDASGNPHWRWSPTADPLLPKEEYKLLESGALKRGAAYYQPVDVESKKVVHIHSASVEWNEYRKRWVMIAVEQFALGDIWYAEASEPTGPWLHAVRVLGHDNYSFYGPCQHPFLAQDGGRFIYFHGTYTHEFSGNKDATPRYDYNQIMYRLDLADPRLKAARK